MEKHKIHLGKTGLGQTGLGQTGLGQTGLGQKRAEKHRTGTYEGQNNVGQGQTYFKNKQRTDLVNKGIESLPQTLIF